MSDNSAEKSYEFTANGVCTSKITYTLRGDTIHHVVFDGGCSGNTQGLSRLLEGMTANEAIRRLRGIKCGTNETSCPDQFARAMESHTRIDVA